jgi:Flp pilus assembly protein TadD
MSNYPAKFLPLYFMVIFLSVSVLYAENESSSMIRSQARSYRQQGWELQTEGDTEAAFACYQKAILLDPNYAVAYNDAGVLLEAMGQPEQAKQMYLKAIEVAPDYPNSYSNLALLYEEEKDYTNAIICWIKRATLGESQDPWTEAARKRLEDIARIYPEAYYDIGQQHKENLQRLEISKVPTQGLGLLRIEEPKEVNLFDEYTAAQIERPDNKARALQHLALAKRSFTRGQYVAALKEATVAEYLDSSNEEISAFVGEIRKKLLK